MKKITGTLTGNLKISAPSPGERPQPHNLTTPRLIVTLKLSFRSYFRSEMKRKTSFSFAFLSLNRNFETSVSNLLPFGNTQINLVFRSLNRNFAA